jgi:hypothetical protein
LENAVYLAAYLNKVDGKTSRHIAKWDGSKYVAVADADAQISAVNTFTETYTVTGTKQVQVAAPSVSTEYIYVPIGTMKAEKNMTWTQWLVSDYNTTDYTDAMIKKVITNNDGTVSYEDVSYDDVIVEGQNYGFMVYELSGKWKFVDADKLDLSTNFSQNINYTINIDGSTRAHEAIINNSGVFVFK